MLSGHRRVSLSLLAAVAIAAGLVTTHPARALDTSGPAPVDRAVVRAAGRTSALVHVTAGASLAGGLDAARSAGLETGTVYDPIEVFVAYGTAEELTTLARHTSIERVEANAPIEVLTSSSHQATRGQELLDGDVTLPDGTTIDGSGVGVAVVDSGVDGTHPDLAGRMGGNVEIVCPAPQFVAHGLAGGFTECRGPKEAVPLEDTDTPSAGGHGTHVAGIVAGTGSASGGTYHGAAPGATLYGVGIGTALQVENGLDGLAWVLENHDRVSPPIKVLNASWGSKYAEYGPKGDTLYSATWKLQDALIAEGVTLVWAAGNDGGNGSAAHTFAQCSNPRPGLICVANYDDAGTGARAGRIDPTSSRGRSDQPQTWPDVAAPGTGIVSTCRATLPVCYGSGAPVLDPPNLYASLTGTSMAAPHVAGIAAQMYQVDPTLTPAEVEDVVEDTAFKLAWGSPYGLHTDTSNPDDSSSFDKGHGLVDAVAAIQSLMGIAPGPDPTPPPTPTPGPGDTRYYFHAATGYSEADSLVNGVTFDQVPPAPGSYAESYDVPGVTGGYPVPLDPHWTGRVDGPFTRLTLDLWVSVPVGQTVGEVHVRPIVFVEGQMHRLPMLIAETGATTGNLLQHVTRTYTTMLDASGAEVPLSIDPQGKDMTIAVDGGRAMYDDVLQVVYDNPEYPSGFSID